MSLWDSIKDTASDAWDTAKSTGEDLYNDPSGTLWKNKGKIATMGAGPLGLAAGAIFDRDYSKVGEGKKYEDLPWYDRAGATLKATGEGLLEGAAGLVGLEDEVGHENQDILAGLKHDAEDDYGTSFNTGGSITGGSGGKSPQGQAGGAMGEPTSGSSLGRALAVEQEPALEGQNYNNNNFNF